MHVSVFDLFKIGIGPSSSHTVGPMKAARSFVQELGAQGLLAKTEHVQASLYGSLGATGKGHGTDKAVILGLMGFEPATVPVDRIGEELENVRSSGRILLDGVRPVAFPAKESLVFLRGKSLPHHPNGMGFSALDSFGNELLSRVFYSVGGGFIVREDEISQAAQAVADPVPLPFDSAAELLAHCRAEGISISEVQRRNELASRPQEALREGLDAI